MIGIGAMTEGRVIGKDGGIPWHSTKDFAHFRQMTLGRDVVFGRRTFQDLPILKGRRVWVLGSGYYNKVDGAEYPYRYTQDINDLPKDCVVAGGAKVYEALLPYCDEFYLTLIRGEYDGDTCMPPFEHLYADYELLESDEELEMRRYFR